MLHIGITGGVGAGKSEILKYLEQEYNCRVLLADEVAHDLMEPGTDCYSRLRQLFAGDGVFAEDGAGSTARLWPGCCFPMRRNGRPATGSFIRPCGMPLQSRRRKSGSGGCWIFL